MASPQTEHGYFRVAIELAEALYRFPFSGQELRLVMWVMRDSYGWNRKETSVRTVKALAEITLVPRSTISWAINKLIKSGVLIRGEKGGLLLNKNYDEWIVSGDGMLNLTSNPLDVQSIRRSVGPLDEKEPPIRCLKTISKDKVCKPAAFTPPTIEEIKAYCLERKNVVDAEKFFHHYEANGWLVGRNKMKNWRSSVCYWERTSFAKGGAATATGKPCPLCEVNPLPYPNAIVCDRCGIRCRACNLQTARLKVVRRRDGTKTAVCADGCGTIQDLPERKELSPKDTEAHRIFMAEYERRKSRKEKS